VDGRYVGVLEFVDMETGYYRLLAGGQVFRLRMPGEPGEEKLLKQLTGQQVEVCGTAESQGEVGIFMDSIPTLVVDSLRIA